jgi:hypothetical protein
VPSGIEIPAELNGNFANLNFKISIKELLSLGFMNEFIEIGDDANVQCMIVSTFGT